jgi:VIT1/CCC1 family predicted Fe2+/Mn2+ transporter
MLCWASQPHDAAQANRVDTMPEQHPMTSDQESETNPIWATLMEKALDGMAHILRSEIHTFETGIEASVEALIDDALIRLAAVTAMLCGAIFLLCAFMLLLHQWLPWWLSFGIAGLSVLAAGILSHAISKPSRRRTRESSAGG